MSLHSIIFSKTAPYKYYRHIIFWSGLYVFFLCYSGIYIFFGAFSWKDFLSPVLKFDGHKLNTLFDRYQFISFIIDMVFTYLVVYRLIPGLLAKKKYLKFITSLVGLSVVTYMIEGVMCVRYFDRPKFAVNGIWLQTWFHTKGFLTSGLAGRFGLFLAFKMLKNYYEKMEEKANLVKENAGAELQLLKAQVHPHFLFNTLNNIYSFTLNKSPIAGELVLKLSDTLNYMINDCEAPLVSLEKELKMIEDYIGLEKVRYGDRLNISLEIEGDCKNKLIVPLLLIPFVENSFKHGSSKMLQHSWIKLKIIIKENVLHMDLNNSKPFQVASQGGRNGIGLKNVQKRLQLLYPGRNVLIIGSTDEEFSVHMQIPLEQIYIKGMPAKTLQQIIPVSQSPSYA
jgi:sensor histidine kinase YesM